MWVAATRLGFVIQLFPHQGAVTIHKELGLGGSVVDQLVSKLPKDDGNCQRWALPLIGPQIRKLRTQVSICGFANLISYRKSAKQQAVLPDPR